MRLLTAIFSFLAPLMVLAGCGGGGGGGDTGNVNLADGPRIQSIAPAPNADAVDLDSIVEFVFEQPLDPASVGPAQVLVYREGIAVAGSVSYSNARRAIVFAATQPLPSDATLRVKLMPGIRDLEDRERQAPLEYDFTTRLPVAASPVRIGFAQDKYWNPADIRVNKQGRGVLVYTLQDFNGPDTRYARVWSAAQGLGAAHTLQVAESTSTNTGRGHDVGPARFITAWKTNAHTNNNDALLQWFDMGTEAWSGEVSLETTGSFEASYPDARRSAAGFMMAVWEQEHIASGRKDIVTRTYKPGTGWGLRIAIDGGLDDAVDPRMAMNEAGQTVVTFYRIIGSERQMFGRTWDPVDGWTDLTPLGSAGVNNARPRQAIIAADGTAIVAWSETVNGDDKLYTRRFNPAAQGGAAWEPRRDLTPVEGDVGGVHGRMDASGNATLVFQYDATAGRGIWQVRYTAGQGWESPTPIGLPDYSTFRRWFVEVDAGGMAIMWTGRRVSPDLDTAVFAAVTGSDGRFGTAIRVAALEGDRPGEYWGDIARAPDGGAALLWRDVSDRPTGDESIARYRAVAADGSLGALQDLDLTPGVMHHSLRLDVDGRGRGMLVYSRADVGETREQMWAAEIR